MDCSTDQIIKIGFHLGTANSNSKLMTGWSYRSPKALLVALLLASGQAHLQAQPQAKYQSQSQAQEVIQAPLAPQSSQPLIQAPQPINDTNAQSTNSARVLVPPQLAQAGTINPAPLRAEPIVTPPAQVLVPQVPLILPSGVDYVAPTYNAPGANWAWAYHPRFGWGWHHPERGWHRRW